MINVQVEQEAVKVNSEIGNFIAAGDNVFVIVEDGSLTRLVNLNHPTPFVVKQSFANPEQASQWLVDQYGNEGEYGYKSENVTVYLGVNEPESQDIEH
ncbi:hypothetical protein [Brevibacillus reuszeri]|uniref:hypothetical protein n=1 Tax=Brevibacillus reuszeri TaxID=54915 RepID=UPI000CCC4774|nr:hypothetical protein [Brevibacillus reuszeri]